MLVPMAKVEIIGPKNRFFDVVTLLHEQGKVHIEDLSKKIRAGEIPLDQMRVDRDRDVERERMEDLLIRVRSITKALHLPGKTVDKVAREKEYLSLWKLDSMELADEVTKVIDEVEDRTSTLASSQADMESELQLLARYEPILQKIQPLAKQVVTTGNFDSVALLVERRYKSALEQLKDELDKITKRQCEIVSTDVDEDTTAAIVVFAKAYSDPVHKFLAMENVNQIRLPSEFDGMPFDTAYDEIKRRRTDLPQDLGSVKTELEKMSDQWYLKLATVSDVLTDKIAEITTIPKFGQTEYAFVVTGWTPVADLSELERELQAAFGSDVIITQKEIGEHDFAETPVSLKNAKAIAPFQTLLNAYGTPKYGTLDPTWMLFLFYPLLFGMIVGDIGYGLLMLALVVWLRTKHRDNEAVQLGTAIFGPAATAVVLFGFLYGEFFGDLLTHYLGWIRDITVLGINLPFHRVQLYMPFMLIAIGVGVVQVSFGLILGVVNGLRTKHMKHVWEKGGILGMLVFIALAVVAGLPVVTDGIGGVSKVLQLVFLFGFFVAGYFMLRGGGFMGVVETMETVAHMASYIRIMAVGLAGAIFADAVNQIISETNIVLGIIIALFLHGLNFVIVAFSPTIHAVRLNFLEFFGKFYETGGEQYKPFQKTGEEKRA
jgi:V/A-type H+-transporting ATPase subunit I